MPHFLRARRAVTTTAVCGAVVATVPAAPALAAPALAADERAITSLEVDVRVDRDATVRVTERLTYDFGDDGSPVRRRLPHNGSIAGSPEIGLGLRDVEIADTGGVRPVEIDERNNVTEVVIGASDRPLTGTRTFAVAYSYDTLVVRGESGRPRVFLNAVGSDWSLPVRNITVELDLPGEPESVDCYAGTLGDRTPCSSSETGGGGNASFTQDGVEAGQTMSVDVLLPEGAVDAEPPSVEEADGSLKEMWPITAFGLGVVGLVLAFIIFGDRTPVGGGGTAGGGGAAGGGDGGAGDAGGGGGD